MNHSVTSAVTFYAPFSKSNDGLCKGDKPEQEPLVRFNHRSSHHRRDLLHWCRQNWDSTFRRSLSQSNSVYYHDCCTSFSRRGFVKVAGHPQLESSSVQRIPSFKTVTDGDKLYHWMLGIFAQNAARGQPSYFPAVNRFHLQLETQDNEDIDEQVVFLKKRVEDLQNNFAEQGKRLKEIETMNNQLLASSKSWHQKYYSLLDKQEPQIPSEFETPVKRTTKYFEFSELF